MIKETSTNNQALLKKIAQRLQQTEDRAASLVNRLESHQKIQDSIDNANKELHETCSAVTNLSLDVKSAVEEFVDAVFALKEITAMLQETDSAAIHEKLDLIRQENKSIGDVQELIRKNIDAATNRIIEQQKIDAATHNERLDMIPQSIKRIGDGQELIHKNIDAATDRAIEQQKIDSAVRNEKLELMGQNIKRVGNGQELIHKNIETATEKVVASLKPRTLWEGVFGRRKD